MRSINQLLFVCVVVGILSLLVPTESAVCTASGITCYPADCGTQFQQVVGINVYSPQDVVPGALCYQGAIINASDPLCAPHTTTTSFVTTTTGSVSTTGGSTTGGEVPDLSASLSLSDFNILFPNANSAFKRGDAGQYGIFTYANLIAAAKYFPEFGSTGNKTVQLREIAAFLAQTSHESSGWWDGQPFVWGYVFSTELCGVKGDPNCVYCNDGAAGYACVAGKSYHGRGPIQLSWNYNYGRASDAIFGNADLLNNPDLILQDGVLAFRTALWFWMTPSPTNPSPHAVMTGLWTPTEKDLHEGRVGGYGVVTDIINGTVECNKTTPTSGTARVGYFKTYAAHFGVDTGSGNLFCDTMMPF